MNASLANVYTISTPITRKIMFFSLPVGIIFIFKYCVFLCVLDFPIYVER